MEERSVYLDYNATTPLEPKVLQVIHDSLDDAWGNPSSKYPQGVKAKRVIDEAREHLAHMIGVKTSDIIFTSGGTEANNMVLHTAVDHFCKSVSVKETKNIDGEVKAGRMKPHIVTSNIEHDSIKLPLEHFQKTGIADVTFVEASRLTGRVEAVDVLAVVRPTTCLVTIMLANNETGIIQPVKEICKMIKLHCKGQQILLHTDAAQAIGKIEVDAVDLGVDYLTIVGHKFYGPRIGCLYVRDIGISTPLDPMLYGGGQERNYRPGTENTGMIAGLGKAAELVKLNLKKYERHMKEVRDYLEHSLTKTFGDERLHFNGRLPGSTRLPNTCNVSVLGPLYEGLKVLSYCEHVQASVGSACHSGAGRRCSPVLLASGVKEEVAANALRLSVGRHTTKQDIDLVLEDLQAAIHRCEHDAHSDKAHSQ